MIRTLLLFSLVLPCRVSGQTAKVDSFYAPSIGSTTRYSYLLPEHYDTLRSYPVLYLLHGYGGDHRNWTDLTDLASYGERLGVIIIMPEGANSWYVNSAGEPGKRYEDLIVCDYPAHVEGRFAVDTTRRAIAGLSMGGYGAIMMSLRHPKQFRFAGSLSGALSIPGGIEFPEPYRAERGLKNLKVVFGEEKSRRDRHDPFMLYKGVPADSLPYLYFVIGTNDGFTTFLPAHRALTDSLRAYGAKHEYHELSGAHNWKLWGKEIRPLLLRMKDVLNGEN